MPTDKTYLNPTAKYNEMAIRAKIMAIDMFNNEIDRIAKKFIPEFYFLDHKVSRTWHCELSPIGMCVNKLYYNGLGAGLHELECIFCGQPSERK
jgi:hypothetical protein